MPFFFESQPPDGSQKIVFGPFSKEASALDCRDSVLSTSLDHDVGDIFTESSNYINTIPKPQMTIPKPDGSVDEVWTDGSIKNIPAK